MRRTFFFSFCFVVLDRFVFIWTWRWVYLWICYRWKCVWCVLCRVRLSFFYDSWFFPSLNSYIKQHSNNQIKGQHQSATERNYAFIELKLSKDNLQLNMKEERRVLREGIVLGQGISYDYYVTNFAVVFFKAELISQLAELIGKEVQPSQYASLIRCDEFVWLLKPCQSESEFQLNAIQRLVGISDTIVCLQLVNFLESAIEKYFCKVQNQSWASFSSSKLVFIKQIYKQKEGVSDIKYFQNVHLAKQFLGLKETLVRNPIKVVDLLQILDCQLAENIPRVRLIHEKYEEIRLKQARIQRANHLVFDTSKSKALIKKEITDMNLSKQMQNKLFWKFQQMHRYAAWLQQEQETISDKLGKLGFDELDDSMGFTVAVKFKKKWSENSFERLKDLFSQIGSENDKIPVKQFHKLYHSMRANLEGVRKSLANWSEGRIYDEMISELDIFYDYHSVILEKSSLSSMRFIKEQAIYLWRYKNNFYKKMAVFFLLGGSAYFQSNLVWSFTLIILAVLTLTLRC